jgi:L-asparagine transporter-like permease
VNESSIFGVSVRAWLALITVVSGLAFLYAAFFLMSENDIRLTIITAVVGFIGLSLGYYLGQKSNETPKA